MYVHTATGVCHTGYADYLLASSQHNLYDIYLLLFININQLDALNFTISLFQASTCFEHMCSSLGGQKLYYTVSGIITHIGGRPVHRLREDLIMSECLYSCPF